MDLIKATENFPIRRVALPILKALDGEIRCIVHIVAV